MLGKLVGHFPICGLLQATDFIKWQATAVMQNWDDQISMGHMIMDMLTRIQQINPTQEEWYVDPRKLDVCVDMSSLAVGITDQNWQDLTD